MDKIVDIETFNGWSSASRKDDINQAIHPAGYSLEAYNESGKEDAKKVMEFVNPGDVVLDYGCGNGRVLHFIPNNKVGIDVVRYCDWVILPYEYEGKADVIYSISVFIHNTQETGANILKWMAEHLNDGGKVLVQIPIYDKHKDPGMWVDVGVWTEDQLRKAAEDAGLKVVEVHKNKGEFSFERIGKNHGKFQILTK